MQSAISNHRSAILLLLLAMASFGHAAVTNSTSGGVYATIAGAVSAAQPGDVLLVSTGIYEENTITIGKNLDIRGGYDDTFTTLDPSQNSLIASANGGGLYIVNATVSLSRLNIYDQPNYGLYLDSATVMASRCNIVFHYGLGGGVWLQNGSRATLDDTSISQCTGDSTAGGGATVNAGCALVLTNGAGMQFNWSTYGGGVRVYSNATLDVQASSYIEQNAAELDGGGIFADLGASVRVDNSTIGDATAGNIASNNGGGICAVGATVVLTNIAYVQQNVALNHGGGIYAASSDLSVLDRSLIGDLVTTNQGNHAMMRGGGIYASGGTLVVDSSAVRYNVSRTSTGAGCALMGGIQAWFTNSVIGDNSAVTFGGGIYFYSSTLPPNAGNLVVADTIVTNNELTGVSGGGGMYINTLGTACIKDSRFVSNRSALGGGALQIAGGTIALDRVTCRLNTVPGGGAGLVNQGAILTITDSVIENNTAGVGGAMLVMSGSTELKALTRNCALSLNSAIMGGGIFAMAPRPVLLNGESGWPVVVDYNQAENGGGIYADQGSTLACRGDVRIMGNYATVDGGGIYTTNATVALHGVAGAKPIVANNTAAELGGGLCLLTASQSVMIADAVLMNNHGGYGGAAFLLGGTLSNCTIQGNTAGNLGGGVRMGEGAMVVRSHVFENVATNYGGGISVNEHGAVIECVVSNNVAVTGGGGGVDCYDADSGAQCLVRGSLVVRNAAGGTSAGIYADGGTMVESCTIADNNPGGVMLVMGGRMRNSVIWSNATDNVIAGAGSIIDFSCVSPVDPAWGAEGCISNDPLFANQAAGDYHHQLGSPCIDTGTNLDWMMAATDLDGSPRIHDGRTDMGCYEFVPEPAIAGVMALFVIGYSLFVRQVRQVRQV